MSVVCAVLAATALLVHPDEFNERWVDRAVKLGVDVLGIHPAGGGTADKSLEDLLREIETSEFRAKVDAAKRRGLKVEYEMHVASWLLPRILFAEHPEYFRMDKNGVRTPVQNFCVSAPDAMKIVCARAVELARRLYGSTHRYYFWLDDVWGDGGCKCADCAKLTASDQQLVYLNVVVAALRREIPDASVAYLAYHGTMSVPQKIKPADGVFLEFAPINRDMTKPFCVQNASELRNVQSLLSFFGKERARVLEYWFDNSYFSHWKKPAQKFLPRTDVIWSDRVLYRDLGFAELCSFACFLGEDYVSRWGEPDLSAFRGDIEHVVLKGPKGARAVISTMGAKVLSYVPAGGREVFFRPITEPEGCAEWVHGGMPICWPWFGFNRGKEKGIHGYARTLLFSIKEHVQAAGGDSLTLTLTPDSVKSVCPEDRLSLEMTFTLTDRLRIEMRTQNCGQQPVKLTCGLHPYFSIGERDRTTVVGTDGLAYCDTLQNDAQLSENGFNEVQKGNLALTKVFDQVFTLKCGAYAVLDPVFGRRIDVTCSGCRKLIVWNPGPPCDSETDPALGREGWRHLVCAEPGTTFGDVAYELFPGDRHALDVTIRISDENSD